MSSEDSSPGDETGCRSLQLMTDPAVHWDGVYRSKDASELSWFEPRPATSLRLLTTHAGPAAPVIDVGGGAATLVDELLDLDWADVTVLDASAEALRAVRQRIDGRLPAAHLIVADVLTWQPTRLYDVWHDRAVFHFLATAHSRQTYVTTASAAVAPGGVLILGTFAPDGPTHCSGLPTARYGAADVAAVFTPAFELEHAERAAHTTPGGVVQPFTWSVLRRAPLPAGAH